MPELRSVGGISYREAGPDEGPTVLMLHGFPESSYMWRTALEAAASAGWRAIAPDLAGFGDSPPDRPGTWEHHMESVEELRQALSLGAVVLVVHDWGGLIGLRWACEHPEAVRGLVISGSGFFADGKWHGMARGLREEGAGEKLVADMTRESFTALMTWAARGIGDAAIAEFWKAFEGEERRAAHLELYRSGDFEKLRPYEGRLAELGVPTLLLWGEDDQFAPVAGAHRFKAEVPHAELVVMDGAGHFVWEEQPDETAAELGHFLRGLPAG